MRVVVLDPYFESLGGGEKVVVVIAEHLAKDNEVIIVVKHSVDKKFVSKYFNVPLDNVQFEVLPNDSLFVRAISVRYFKLPGRWKSIIYDRASLKAIKRLNPDLFINSLYQSSLPSPAPKSIYICMFPQKLKPEGVYSSLLRKLHNWITNNLEALFIGTRRKAIDSYSVIVANSNYTAGWIKRYWQKNAVVLYPPCDDMGPPAVKQNIILSVGRFFADNGSSHHKRQDELIKAFIKLDKTDWELHIAGSVATDKDSARYFTSLENLAKSHDNIFIHPNMPFEELKKLRQQASIYWHAAGYGYDADLYPENQEHFGMVTAEAMSAGAIPVVYNSAGQLEVVKDGNDGFLWNTINELIEYSNKLIDDPKLRRKMEKNAVERAQDFDRYNFNKQIDKLMSKL
jgi:glycosyltransferase involved in cell wall biosynthesis